jgi:hypothetical protein
LKPTGVEECRICRLAQFERDIGASDLQAAQLSIFCSSADRERRKWSQNRALIAISGKSLWSASRWSSYYSVKKGHSVYLTEYYVNMTSRCWLNYERS